MKNQRKSVIVSPAVAAAINSLLFSSDGVDMTPVIDALAADKSRNRTSVAITTALLLKGAVVEPTKEIRYRIVNPGNVKNWAKMYVKEYTYKGYAAYDDKVYYQTRVVYAEPQDGESVNDLCRSHSYGYTEDGDMHEVDWENLLEFDELPKDVQACINGEKALNELCGVVDPE